MTVTVLLWEVSNPPERSRSPSIPHQSRGVVLQGHLQSHSASALGSRCLIKAKASASSLRLAAQEEPKQQARHLHAVIFPSESVFCF